MNKVLMLALLSMTAVNLNAWERMSMDTARCQRDGKDMQRCQKENNEDNEHNFTTLLSPQSFKMYNDFLPEQKRMAMDNADNNRMERIIIAYAIKSSTGRN